MTYLRPKFALKPWFALGLSAVLLGLGTPPLLSAENMQSESYMIQFGNFNITAGEKSGGGYKVTDTVGQLAPGEYAGTGYKVFAGFQYIYAIPRFSFRITSLSVELGELTAGIFSQASHALVITTRSGGYTILARADHPLRRGGDSAAFVPFTSCDSSCTTTAATPWIDTANRGFGFNANGTHHSTDFVNTTYFRPFADRSAAQNAAVIAQHTGVVKDDVTTITYKATIPGSQEAGLYSTVVEYTAVPTF